MGEEDCGGLGSVGWWGVEKVKLDRDEEGRRSKAGRSERGVGVSGVERWGGA